MIHNKTNLSFPQVDIAILDPLHNSTDIHDDCARSSLSIGSSQSVRINTYRLTLPYAVDVEGNHTFEVLLENALGVFYNPAASIVSCCSIAE